MKFTLKSQQLSNHKDLGYYKQNNMDCFPSKDGLFWVGCQEQVFLKAYVFQIQVKRQLVNPRNHELKGL